MKRDEIRKPKQPCSQDCPNRKAGCGAECEAWLAYVAERNAAYKENYRKSRQSALTDARLKNIKRNEQRKRSESNSVMFKNKKAR